MKIRDMMTSPALTCGVGDNLDSAAQLMWDHDTGAIPVVDDDGQIVGIVTDRDICMAAYIRGQALQAIPVAETMSNKILAVGADDTLEQAHHAASTRNKNGLDREVTQTFAAICRPRSEPTLRDSARPRRPADH